MTRTEGRTDTKPACGFPDYANATYKDVTLKAGSLLNDIVTGQQPPATGGDNDNGMSYEQQLRTSKFIPHTFRVQIK
jgi:uncharacterized protein YqjF (DUF2071 family)